MVVTGGVVGKFIYKPSKNRQNVRYIGNTTKPVQYITFYRAPSVHSFIKSLHSIPSRPDEPKTKKNTTDRPPNHPPTRPKPRTNMNKTSTTTTSHPAGGGFGEAGGGWDGGAGTGANGAGYMSGGRPPSAISGSAAQMVGHNSTNGPPFDSGIRRRLFAGFRPLSAFTRAARFRSNPTQNRSVSLPESNYLYLNYQLLCLPHHMSNTLTLTHSHAQTKSYYTP